MTINDPYFSIAQACVLILWVFAAGYFVGRKSMVKGNV